MRLRLEKRGIDNNLSALCSLAAIFATANSTTRRRNKLIKNETNVWEYGMVGVINLGRKARLAGTQTKQADC